ncbi:MAG: type II toxin-antitoxin system mRNA interferase toxin, RelE/StbE family [Spirochaetes bacterium]|jgi:mRNA interferase RelE/StbE|nr:type II toxin-antitoxin system mRNA interferase toxin, RelE/StbE family [Spirochaetota bacterium]
MRYSVELTSKAKEMLDTIQINLRKKLVTQIRTLENEPEKKGKPLCGELSGFYSLHFSRYRVIYTIDHGRVIVIVVAIGIRRDNERYDIYELAKKIIRSGLTKQ